MARWKLNSSHYLNVEGAAAAEWEYEEMNRETNRKIRKRYPVPLLLDTTDPQCFNPKSSGMIIVANKYNPAFPLDYIYTGPPTPEMEPIDEEAESISKAESKNWIHPIEALPGQGFNQSLLGGLEKQLAELISVATTGKAAPVSNGPTREEFEAMQKQLFELMAQNQELQKSERRSV